MQALRVVVVYLGLLLLGSSAVAAATSRIEPAVSVAPVLHTQLPQTTVGYARIPSFWGALAAPNGRVLDAGMVHPRHVAAIEKVRQAFAAEPVLSEGPASALRLLFSHWSGPLELVLLAPQGQLGPDAQLLVSLPLSGLADHQALLVLLASTGAPLQLDEQGYGVVPGGALHFDPAQGRLLALLGDEVGVSTLMVLQDGLRSARPVFADAEQRIDQSGQGLFVWLDLTALQSAFALAALTDPSLAVLEGLLADAKALSFGFGTVQGKGRLGIELEAPGAGLLRYLAREPKRFAVRSAGVPGYAASLSFLYSPEEFKQLRTALREDHGQQVVDQLDNGLAELDKLVGFRLTDMLAALGPDQLMFGDDAGDFFAVKVRNRQAWQRLFDSLAKLDYIDVRQQGGIYMMEAGDSSNVPAGLDGVAALFLRLRSRVYWTDEGEYLVFASTPQALRDRKAARPDFGLERWLQAQRGPQVGQSTLLVVGQTRDVARRTYYFGLQVLDMLSDLVGARVDPFSFASASELKLPRAGTAGMGLEVSADRLALAISYDATGIDLFTGAPGVTTVAVLGIVAAIALPAYQDYVARAQVAEALAVAGAARVAISEHYATHGTLPESLEVLGVPLQSRYAELGWEDGLLLVRLHDIAPVNTRLRGGVIALALSGDGQWHCGFAADLDESTLLGASPAAVTDVPTQLLPGHCR